MDALFVTVEEILRANHLYCHLVIIHLLNPIEMRNCDANFYGIICS